jgi:DNA-binding NarL/FixJ family response regulator
MNNFEPLRTRKYRILVVDDHPIVRRGLTQCLEDTPDIEVCGEADSLIGAMQEIAKARPDLVLVDLSLKDSHGIELIAAVKERDRHTKMLVWSMFDEKLFAERALRAGASGFINKQEPIEKVLIAIRQVLRGELYLSTQMTNLLLRRVGKGASLDEDPVRSLTNRELEVFQLIGKGMTTQQVANGLDISRKTVEAHREKIKVKMNLRNAAELTRYAVQWVLENA